MFQMKEQGKKKKKTKDVEIRNTPNKFQGNYHKDAQ